MLTIIKKIFCKVLKEKGLQGDWVQPNRGWAAGSDQCGGQGGWFGMIFSYIFNVSQKIIADKEVDSVLSYFVTSRKHNGRQGSKLTILKSHLLFVCVLTTLACTPLVIYLENKPPLCSGPWFHWFSWVSTDDASEGITHCTMGPLQWEDGNRTKNRLMVAFDSNKGPNLKVVKWSWK